MRLGVVLPWPIASTDRATDGRAGRRARTTDDLVRLATAAEQSALDLVWVDAPHPGAGGAPLAVAAALAPHTRAVAVGVTVEVGEAHPLVVAEEIAVADQLLGGRLVTALTSPAATSGDDRAARYLEAAEIVTSCLAPLPFRHEGQFWRVPAGLPGNRFGVEERVRMTPPTVQIEPTLWFAGPQAEDAAGHLGGSWLAGRDDGADAARTTWARLADRLGGVTRRLRRPALRRAEPLVDDAAGETLAADLRAERAAWGLDCALLDPGADPRHSTDQLVAWLTMVGSVVRPRVQLDALPPGLEQHWRGRPFARTTQPTQSQTTTSIP